MAKKKISELPAVTTPLTGDELLVFVQGGVSKQGTVDDLPVGGGGAVDSVNGDTGTVVVDLQSVLDEGPTAVLDAGTVAEVSIALNDGDDERIIEITEDGPALRYINGADQLEVTVGAGGLGIGGTINGVSRTINFTELGGITTQTPTVGDNSTKIATTAFVETRVLAAIAGLKWKDSVRVATTVAGTLATSFENGDTIDGIVLATGNRILIKNQASAIENGIYVVAASGAPTRSTDADAAAELEGATVTVQEGTSNANTTWTQTTDGITLGVSNIVWSALGTSVSSASESTAGIAELATQAETDQGDDDARIVTPLKLLVKGRKSVTVTGNTTIDQEDHDQGFLIANSATAIVFDFPSLEAGTIITIININAGDVTWTNSGGTSFTGGLTSLVGGTLGAATFRYQSTTVIEVFGGMPTQVENLTISGSLAVKAGASAGAIAKVGGTIHVDTTQTGNVGTGEDTLFTYSVPANILNTNKDSISIVAAGSIANSINAKRLRIKFGATTILDTGAAGIPVSAAITWTLRATIIRTGAATQKCVASLNTDNATLASYNGYVTAAETLSGAVTLLITGEATTNSDIVGEMFKITFDPAP